MTALAEVLWSPKEKRDWDSFLKRYQEFKSRLDNLNVNYSKGSWKVEIHPSLQNGKYTFELASEQYQIPIHYTLDNSDPTNDSPVYTQPFTIEKSTVIKAGLFADGKLMEYATEKELVFHKGIGKDGYLSFPASEKYPAKGAVSLIDGLRGSDNYRDGYWLGFQGKDLEFEVDLGEVLEIKSIAASFFQNTGAWIFMPETVSFVVLDGDKNEVASRVLYPESTMEVKGTIIEDIASEFDNIKGRFVKIQATNIKTIPDWHEGAGGRAWIFADEVVIK
ncbi:MAG: chitobiase/beta-hexosaminidase C-terminal domain-containing protein [Bacteroidales bacterium]